MEPPKHNSCRLNYRPHHTRRLIDKVVSSYYASSSSYKCRIKLDTRNPGISELQASAPPPYPVIEPVSFHDDDVASWRMELTPQTWIYRASSPSVLTPRRSTNALHESSLDYRVSSRNTSTTYWWRYNPSPATPAHRQSSNNSYCPQH